MLDPLTLLLAVFCLSNFGLLSTASRLGLLGWTSSKSIPSAVTVSS
jgi:hypothetical protein